MVKQQQIYAAVNKFIDQELAPMTSGMSSIQQLVFGFQLGVIKRKSQSLIQSYLNNPATKLMQLAEGDEVDIEILYQALLEAINKQGSVEVIGIKFTSSDVNKLYSMIKEQMV